MFDDELFLDSDEVIQEENAQESYLTPMLEPTNGTKELLARFFQAKNNLVSGTQLSIEEIVTDENITMLTYLPFGNAMNVFYMAVDENKNNNTVASLNDAFLFLDGDPQEEDIDGYKLFFQFQRHCMLQHVPNAYIGSLLIVFLRICMRYDL